MLQMELCEKGDIRYLIARHWKNLRHTPRTRINAP